MKGVCPLVRVRRHDMPKSVPHATRWNYLNAEAPAYVPKQVTSQPVLINFRLVSLVTQPFRYDDVSHVVEDRLPWPVSVVWSVRCKDVAFKLSYCHFIAGDLTAAKHQYLLGSIENMEWCLITPNGCNYQTTPFIWLYKWVEQIIYWLLKC